MEAAAEIHDHAHCEECEGLLVAATMAYSALSRVLERADVSVMDPRRRSS